MTTDTGMVERIARAMWAERVRYAREAHGYDLEQYEYMCGFTEPVGAAQTVAAQNNIMGEARAVLECLRTPTPEMVEALIIGCGYTIGGKHVPCNHESAKRLDEATGSKLYEPQCDYLNRFSGAIDRALSPSKGEGE